MATSTIAGNQPLPLLATPAVPRLENGDHLSRAEFERRWAAMPELNRAELLDGMVFMPAALRQDQHGRPHSYITAWLANYGLLTPGVDFGTAASIRLDIENEPQPDCHLCLPVAAGSTATVDAEGYVTGAPDLVVEVSASTVSIDLHRKLSIYERHGVREYIVWRVLDEEVDWLVLKEGKYQPLARDAEGWFRSPLFPGLWLQPDVLLHGFPNAIHTMMHAGLQSPEHAAFVAKLAALAQQNPPAP